MVEYLRVYFILENQMDNMCAGKDWTISQRPRLCSAKVSGDLSLAEKKKQQ